MRRTIAVAACRVFPAAAFFFLTLDALGAAQSCQPKLYAPAGTPSVSPALQGPGLLLVGGGTDIARDFTWANQTLFGTLAGRHGNVLVLRAYGDNDYDAWIYNATSFASVRTLLIKPCVPRATVDTLAPYVDAADMVFFSGGDQGDYAPWKGTALIAAIKRLYARGGVVGGTSAGLAMQGAVDFDAVAADRLNVEVHTADAVPNPFERRLSLTTGYFAWPPLANTITDTHYAKRNRFGRSVVFLARAQHAGYISPSVGYVLGIDQESALGVDRYGHAVLMTSGRSRGVYLVSAGRQPIARGLPFHYTVQVLHVYLDNAKLNLMTHQGQGDSYGVTVDSRIPGFYSRDPYEAPR